jgi:hypothetical protein
LTLLRTNGLPWTEDVAMRAQDRRDEYIGRGHRVVRWSGSVVAAILGAAVALGGLGVAGGRAVAAERAGSIVPRAVDEWDDLMIALIDLLLEILRHNPPPKLELNGTVVEWAAELNKAYWVGGIPENLTGEEVETLMGVIEALAVALGNAPASFDPACRVETMATLRAMYAELGGDPEELGG